MQVEGGEVPRIFQGQEEAPAVLRSEEVFAEVHSFDGLEEAPLLSSEAMAAYSGLTTKHLVPLVHLLGIATTLLMIIWTYSFRGGYGLSGTQVFNLHPLLMFAGFIYLSSEAIISFKSGHKKSLHMALQGAAIALALSGVLAAYKFHLDYKIQNFYSLHSWLGLTTIAIYLVQWVIAFVAFWRQSVAKPTRTELLPWHVFFGFVAYIGALVSAELGLLEKLTFLQKMGEKSLGLWSGEALLVNFLGVAICVFGGVVVLTTLVPKARRDAKFRDLLE